MFYFLIDKEISPHTAHSRILQNNKIIKKKKQNDIQTALFLLWPNVSAGKVQNKNSKNKSPKTKVENPFLIKLDAQYSKTIEAFRNKLNRAQQSGDMTYTLWLSLSCFEVTGKRKVLSAENRRTSYFGLSPLHLEPSASVHISTSVCLSLSTHFLSPSSWLPPTASNPFWHVKEVHTHTNKQTNTHTH